MNFENIAGYESEKKELLQLRYMLHNAAMYREQGIRIPHGLALYGEPGIGKTVMARSIADDGIALIELRAADCCSDETEGAIRMAFEHAKENAPAVLLLDELDKLAGTSPRYFMETNDDVKKILLQELDRLDDDDDVLVVATCNNTECLGDALLRPGRFDRLIAMNAPDAETRKKILRQYFGRLNLKKNFDIDYISRITCGYTGAEIECLANETGIRVIENRRKSITERDIRNVMNHMAFNGSERKPTEDRNELRKVAIHEAGHALVAMKLLPDCLFGASIMPQGGSAGHIHFLNTEEKVPSIEQVEKEVAVLLAGRVAERTVSGEICLGAESDLGRAVHKMMYLINNQAAYGYKFLLGGIGPFMGSDNLSEASKQESEATLERHMNELDAKAAELINSDRETFDRIVDALVERRVLSKDELFELAEEQQKAA